MTPTPDPAQRVTYPQLIAHAAQGQLTAPGLQHAADALVAQGHAALTVTLYRTWLQHTTDPHRHLVWFNLGVLLADQGDDAAARDAYGQALQLAPAFAAARYNLGRTLERLGQPDGALAQWQWIDAHVAPDDDAGRPLRLMALGNLARVHEAHGRLAEALDCQTRSLQLEPQQPDVVHHWVAVRARMCLWPVFVPLPGLDVPALRGQASGLVMAALSDDPAEQLATARAYARRRIDTQLPRLAPARPYGHPRLRIGYASGDFWQHPVAALTVELFEQHDRARVEVIGLDWSRDDGSALRRRVLAAFDQVLPLQALDDAAAADAIRRLEIDILVDLQGQTQGARPAMLARRPAPLQLTWLGLPATTGLPFIDHVLADRYLIPEAEAMHYSERPLYLPEVFQPSDRQRRAAAPPARAACGLPEAGFVFCCFNNSYKITPEMFGVWMAILQRVPGSVLWLVADNAWASSNLRREAHARGVDAARLVFAPRVPAADHLARCAVADLFLDSYPFNGGTTANDALWMGLPVLTRSGRTYASRMAGSLLTAAGLPGLICGDADAYAQQAVAIATTPGRARALRDALLRQRDGGVLFDTPRLARHLEQLYAQLAAGDAPAAVRPGCDPPAPPGSR